MRINYNNLWKQLIDRNMKKKDLQSATGISWASIAKMSKNELVEMEVILKICNWLQCDIGEVITLNYKKEEDTNMITTLDDFIREFKKIVDMGWITTHRAGPTGIGKTLEDLLGIVENNLDAPDFGDYELKSCRLNSNSMLTMFTLSPQPARSNTYLREKYGYASGAYDNDEKVLHATLSADRFTRIAYTGHSLKIAPKAGGIYIESEIGVEDVYWTREALKKAFEKKYKNKFVYAKAEAKGAGSSEQFKFTEAYEVSGFDYDAFVKLLEQGVIYVDLRIGQYHAGPNKGKTHDHGTGFRIREIDQPLLFKVKRKVV